MKPRVLPPARKRAGFALLSSLIAMLAAASLALMLMTYAAAANRTAEGRRFRARADYLAEGAVEVAKTVIRDAVTTSVAPLPAGNVVIGATPVAYTIAALGPTQIEMDASGLQTFVTTYRIDAQATVTGFSATSHRLVRATATPIFQFAVFYENDMELWPGPPMTVSGRLHCNSDVFLGSGDSLTIDTNYFHVAGRLYGRRKHSADVAQNRVRIRRWVADPWDGSEPVEYVDLHNQADMSAFGVATASGYDSDFDGYDADGDGDYYEAGDWLPFSLGCLEQWSEPAFYAGGMGHTIMTGEHDVARAAVPKVISVSMFQPDSTDGDYVWSAGGKRYVPTAPGSGTHSPGAFHERAGLSIITHEDGTWEALDEDGGDVSAALAGAVSLTQTYDARQAQGSGGKIDVTVIDVAALNASGVFPPNGLLYAGTYGAGTGTEAKGIQLTGGAELLAPLTVVSESSVYVHGDYNTIGKKPAAVIADAVNLLSNSWDNSKTPGSIPGATPTTFNVAMVTGDIESQVGNYNGGVENLPRFHEDWTSVECRIDGSIACLWTSRFATGDHSGVGDLRIPPDRNWNFDTGFNDPAKLPPFTPMSTAVNDVVTW